LHPGKKTGVELLRVKGGKEIAKGIMRENAVGQVEKTGEPSCLASPNCAISTHESAPKTTAHKAIVRTMSRGWFRPRFARGSGSAAKCAGNEASMYLTST